MEALTPTVGMAGLGHWGKNLVRNFDALADLRALCDVSPDLREGFARRYPNTRVTADFSELVEDLELDAIVIATPCRRTTPSRSRRSRAASTCSSRSRRRCAARRWRLAALAAEQGLTCMPGHLLLYHPAVRKLKQLVDAGELGDVLCVYGNRQNLGIIRKDENALWSLGVHDLSVILYLLDEEPSEAWAHGNAFLNPGVEDVVFCYLRFPSGKIAHMHLSWLDPHTDAEDHRRRPRQDGRLRRHGPRRKVTIYEKGRGSPRRRTASGRRGPTSTAPRSRTTSHFGSVPALPRARAGRGVTGSRSRATGSRWFGPLEQLQSSLAGIPGVIARPLSSTRAPCSAKVCRSSTTPSSASSRRSRRGRPPAASRSSRSYRRRHDRLHRRDRVRRHEARRARDRRRRRARRERCVVGDDVVIGSGSLVENDTTIGALTKIQAEAYITAYSTLEDEVFIAPCVVTTNDNFMGRTEKRHELVRGPTIRRGARIGGGAVLCPGVEIGEEAFVGAGAVVTKDVPPRRRRRKPRARPARRARRGLSLGTRGQRFVNASR